MIQAIGHDFVAALMTTILGSLGFAFGGAAIAGIMAYKVWRNRNAAAS